MQAFGGLRDRSGITQPLGQVTSHLHGRGLADAWLARAKASPCSPPPFLTPALIDPLLPHPVA